MSNTKHTSMGSPFSVTKACSCSCGWRVALGSTLRLGSVVRGSVVEFGTLGSLRGAMIRGCALGAASSFGGGEGAGVT
jgi:hypothetical protein